MTRTRRDPRDTLAGTFLILCGLGFTLAGGGCTVGWVASLYAALGHHSPFALLGLIGLLVSIPCAGVGVVAIQHGMRRLRGGGDGARQVPPDAASESGEAGDGSE